MLPDCRLGDGFDRARLPPIISGRSRLAFRQCRDPRSAAPVSAVGDGDQPNAVGPSDMEGGGKELRIQPQGGDDGHHRPRGREQIESSLAAVGRHYELAVRQPGMDLPQQLACPDRNGLVAAPLLRRVALGGPARSGRAAPRPAGAR